MTDTTGRDPLDDAARAFHDMPAPECPPAAPELARLGAQPSCVPAPSKRSVPPCAWLPVAAAAVVVLVGVALLRNGRAPESAGGPAPAPSGQVSGVDALSLLAEDNIADRPREAKSPADKLSAGAEPKARPLSPLSADMPGTGPAGPRNPPAPGGPVPPSGAVSGNVTVDGSPLAAGRVFFHVGKGQFVGSQVAGGKYVIDRVPAGNWCVCCEGDGMPARYAREDTSPLRVELKGAGRFDFDLKEPRRRNP